MRKSNIQFIHDTMVMKKLFHEPSLHKNAQDSFTGVLSSVKSYVGVNYDPNNKVESVLSFIGPGLLWMLGFKWIAVAYELAAALGFDWTHFFVSIKEKIKPFLESLAAGEQKDSSFISSIVQDSATGAFSDNIDTDRLQEVVTKTQSVNDLFFIKKIAQRYSRKDDILKSKIFELFSTTTGNKMRRGMLGFIVKIMSWLLTAVLIACGFNILGSIVKKVLKLDQKKQTEEGSSAQEVSHTSEYHEDPGFQQRKQKVVLHLNPNADQSLSTTTYNDINHVWLLNMSINNIKSNLIKWAQELYQQLNDQSAFDASSSFNRVLTMFRERNKEAGSLEILAVPRPFKSIKEIVDSFAADVAAHMQ